jgi:hypothetical protein
MLRRNDQNDGAHQLHTTHPRKEDTTGLYMQIHEIKRNAALQISMDSRHRHLPPDICNAQIRQVRLSDRFVDFFVFFDSAKKISFRYFPRGILIIGIARTDFESDICRDNSWIVAN